MFRAVIVTTNDEDEAKTITRKIVEEKLAACANIIPRIHSIYWWEGKIENSEEAMILIKTTEPKIDSLIARVKELHSYDNPEIISLPIEKGSQEYLKWLIESTS